MKVTNKAISILTKYESFQPRAYRCPAGRVTIGYGHTKGVKMGQVITEAKAIQLLREDIAEVEEFLTRKHPNLTQNQFDALTCLVFNLGSYNYSRYYISDLIENNAPAESISRAWLNICYAAGKKLKGLERRRAEELELFLS